MKPLSPKHKLIAAAVALAALPLVAASQGLSAAGAARIVLGLVAAAGIGWWFLRNRAVAGAKFRLPPRLNVVQRVGLSQRTGLALVEVDGQALLVVHGDGFARIQRVRKPVQPRVVSPRRGTSKPVSPLHVDSDAHASNGGLT